MNEKKKQPLLRFIGFTEDWEKHKVGEFYNFKNGLNKDKEFFGKGTPIVNFTDVFHNRGLKATQLRGKVEITDKEIRNFEVKQGDIFFTRTSETIEEIGYPSVMLDSPKDTVFSGFLLRGRAINYDPLRNVFKRYVFFTDAFRTEMQQKSSMTTRALTSGKAIREMYFCFPVSGEEQRNIGQFFVTLDNLISLHQRKCELLEQTKKTLLKKLFPRDGENVPEIRFAGFEGNWIKKKLGEILVKNSRKNKDLSILRVESVSNKTGFTKQTEQFEDYSVASEDLSNYYVIKEKYFAYNPSRINVGSIAYKSDGEETSVVSPLYVSFSTNQLIKDRFLWFWFKTSEFERQRQILSEGGVRETLSYNQLSDMIILLPNEVEQTLIGTFFYTLDTLTTHHQEKLTTLKTIKQTLLNQMFI